MFGRSRRSTSPGSNRRRGGGRRRVPFGVDEERADGRAGSRGSRASRPVGVRARGGPAAPGARARRRAGFGACRVGAWRVGRRAFADLTACVLGIVCWSRPSVERVGRDAPCPSGAEPDGLEVPLLDRSADGGGVAADEAGRSPGQYRPRPACARLGRCQHITQHTQSYTSVSRRIRTADIGSGSCRSLFRARSAARSRRSTWRRSR